MQWRPAVGDAFAENSPTNLWDEPTSIQEQVHEVQNASHDHFDATVFVFKAKYNIAVDVVKGMTRPSGRLLAYLYQRNPRAAPKLW